MNAYEKYIQDGEKEGVPRCVEMFRKLREQDARQAEEIKKRLKMVLDHVKV